MLTKCLLALIIAAAFVYALYLLIRKKPFAFQQPSAAAPETFRRTRYLFYLATLIFLGSSGSFLLHASKRERPASSTEAFAAEATNKPELPELAQYEAEARKVLAKMPLRDALQLAWRTLNAVALSSPHAAYSSTEGTRGSESAQAFFKVALEQAVQQRLLSAPAAVALRKTHAKLAEHFLRLHSKETCYDAATLPVEEPMVLTDFSKQLDLLRQARRTSSLSPAVIAKVTQTIRRQMQTLTEINHIDQTTKTGDYNDQLQKLTKLAEAIKNESLAISPVTEEAVLFLLQMEGVSPADAPPAPDAPKASAPTR